MEGDTVEQVSEPSSGLPALSSSARLSICTRSPSSRGNNNMTGPPQQTDSARALLSLWPQQLSDAPSWGRRGFRPRDRAAFQRMQSAERRAGFVSLNHSSQFTRQCPTRRGQARAGGAPRASSARRRTLRAPRARARGTRAPPGSPPPRSVHTRDVTRGRGVASQLLKRGARVVGHDGDRHKQLEGARRRSCARARRVRCVA